MVAQAEQNVTAGNWQHLGSGIEVDHQTATTRVSADVVCPTKLDLLPHLSPVVGIDRPDNDPRADLVVYGSCAQDAGYVYVDSQAVRRMTGESIRKPVGFGLADEVDAEVRMARELVSETQLRRM